MLGSYGHPDKVNLPVETSSARVCADLGYYITNCLPNSMDQIEGLKKDCISTLTNHKTIDPLVACWSVKFGVLRSVGHPTVCTYRTPPKGGKMGPEDSLKPG